MGIIFKSFVQLIKIEASTNLKHTIIINTVGLEHGHIESRLPICLGLLTKANPPKSSLFFLL